MTATLAISVIASAVAVALSLLLTFAPQTGAQKTAPFILLALGIGLIAGRPRIGLEPRWGWAVLALALGLLAPVTAIARAFGDIDMLAILFHVDFGTAGAGLGGLGREVAVAAFGAVTAFTGLVIISQVMLRRALTWIWAAAIIAANPVLREVAAMAMPAGREPASLVADLVDPEIRAADPDHRPDVIIIYLEGMDRIFEDREEFEDTMQRLRRLAGAGAIELTGVGEMVGTGWSLAGMVASQCGVPVLPNGLRFQNNFTEQDSFMGDLTCLGDVLKARGYATAFIMGGEKEFAGINHFYRSHGVADQTDMATIAGLVSQEAFDAAYPGWVLDDQMTLEIARQRHADLLGRGAPLFLAIETMGPHGREVWLSRRCTGSGRAEISTDVRAGVRCTADLVAEFVEELLDAEQARPTLFVILSDHINHNPDLLAMTPREMRRNTAIFIPPRTGADVPPLRQITREATMVDVYPTILDLLDLIDDGDGAGLGVSLLGADPTLVERFGRDGLDRRIARDGILAARLWRQDDPVD